MNLKSMHNFTALQTFKTSKLNNGKLNPKYNCTVYNHHFGWIQSMMEKEAKKEAFRRYLESSGAVDALTKVLVALYEQNNKPASAVEFLQQKLGGPSVAEYEKLQADMSELQSKYDELLAAHQETCRQLEQYKSSSAIPTSEETTENDPSNASHEGHVQEPQH